MAYGSLLKRLFLALFLATSASSCAGETMSPKIRLELRIAPEETGELQALLERFARDQNFSTEEIGSQLPPRQGRKAFYVKLTRGGTQEVLVTDFLEAGRFLVALYELKPDATFQSTASKLEAMLREKWPSSVSPYTDV